MIIFIYNKNLNKKTSFTFRDKEIEELLNHRIIEVKNFCQVNKGWNYEDCCCEVLFKEEKSEK